MGERTEQFKYYKTYNEITDSIDKVSLTMKKRKKLMFESGTYILIAAVVVAMVVYNFMSEAQKAVEDIDGNVIREQTQQMKINGGIISIVYSVVVILFGWLYKLLAQKQTEAENFRFQT